MRGLTEEDAVAAAGLLIRRALARIVAETGLEADLVLLAAHIESTAGLAELLGGDVAAACADRAAERVRGLPPLPPSGLAAMQPAGRA